LPGGHFYYADDPHGFVAALRAVVETALEEWHGAPR
jgi:hypothetical protein